AVDGHGDAALLIGGLGRHRGHCEHERQRDGRHDPFGEAKHSDSSLLAPCAPPRPATFAGHLLWQVYTKGAWILQLKRFVWENIPTKRHEKEPPGASGGPVQPTWLRDESVRLLAGFLEFDGNHGGGAGGDRDAAAAGGLFGGISCHDHVVTDGNILQL